MRQVVWSTDALDDLDAVIEYIAFDSPKSASLVVDRIEAAADLLAEVPAGRPGRVAGTYEKLVLRTPYIMTYRLTDTALTIVRIIHASRDWPDNEWPGE